MHIMMFARDLLGPIQQTVSQVPCFDMILRLPDRSSQHYLPPLALKSNTPLTS
jgi:hypothetical protein